MSKKKATMTLKDFHGGSIPSDLPLPSAPGEIVRPSERGNHDRQTSWGNQAGRSDHRMRPGSAGAARNFDDKAPFLSHSSHIGRNFDEDERKPLDGVSGPRRTFSDDSFRGSSSRVVEPKMECFASVKSASQLALTPGQQHLTGLGSASYVGRSADVNKGVAGSSSFGGPTGVGLNYQNIGGPSGQLASGSSPNAWGLRKEAAGSKDPSPALSSALDASLKLARASALEKVSSGRWHSKRPITSQPDVEGVCHSEAGSELYATEKVMHSKNAHGTPVVVEGMDYQDVTFSNQADKSLSVDDVIHYGGREEPSYERTRLSVHVEANGREEPSYERTRLPLHVEANGRNDVGNSNGPLLPHIFYKPNGSELQSLVPSDTSERPKLKLLPRSKPLDTLELPVDYKQGYQHPPVHAENISESHGKVDLLKATLVGSDHDNPVMERPKLNLKPRLEPHEHSEIDFEGKRNIMFGGARPRELVLKQRGFDNSAGNTEDLAQSSYWTKQDSLKIEKRSVLATTGQHNEKPENITIEQRKGKLHEKRDHRLDAEKTDAQRKNWHGDNWKNKREMEKQTNPQQLRQERPPSPETWRKPVQQQPQSASADTSGTRHVKAASAVELAQAFSRSVPDLHVTDRVGGQTGLPNRQVPFSRLVEPTPRSHINGY